MMHQLSVIKRYKQHWGIKAAFMIIVTLMMICGVCVETHFLSLRNPIALGPGHDSHD